MEEFLCYILIGRNLSIVENIELVAKSWNRFCLSQFDEEFREYFVDFSKTHLIRINKSMENVVSYLFFSSIVVYRRCVISR